MLNDKTNVVKTNLNFGWKGGVNPKAKRVLFVHPRLESAINPTPHVGLAMLASVLKETGHQVLVIDYQIFDNTPSIEVFIEDFSPDVIGVSLYTSAIPIADKIINKACEYKKPIIVGGPHATLYSDRLSCDKRIDYIMRGEAEAQIVDVVENAQFRNLPLIVDNSIIDPKNLPFPDFTSFHRHKDFTIYPLLTSRGCPFNCCFCAVHLLSGGRKWSTRNIEDCIEELKRIKTIMPNMKMVNIVDSNPTLNLSHIKKFLRLFISENLGWTIKIANMRADRIDEELLVLLKQAGCISICFGAEHGDPEVFNQVGKGETLSNIICAAMLTKKCGLKLGLCFVIGLPRDSLEKTKKSIELAKELKPDFIFWNMAVPYKGTKMYQWYEENGKIFDTVGYRQLRGGDFRCDDPCVETPDFSIEDRKKAYFIATLATNNYKLKLQRIPELFRLIRKYNTYLEFVDSLTSKIANFPKKVSQTYKRWKKSEYES